MKMSDTWVRLVPKHEAYIPSAADRVKAVTHFWQTIPDRDDVEAEAFNTLQFFDAGTNGGAYCPNCGAAINRDYWDAWLEEDEDIDDCPLRVIYQHL